MRLSGFNFRVADAPNDNKSIYEALFRLRYQVYVNEWGFEKPEDHPDGLERDSHDSHSRHFYACHDSANEVIGTARIILSSDSIFPIQEHFDVGSFFADIPNRKIAEISRLAISKKFRRRAIDRVIFNKDKAYSDDLAKHQEATRSIAQERRKYEHELIRGLYLLIYRESIELGLSHWCAVMAKGLHVMLCRWGIHFEQIGPEKEHHGVRAPYALSISALEESLHKKSPELLELARYGFV